MFGIRRTTFQLPAVDVSFNGNSVPSFCSVVVKGCPRMRRSSSAIFPARICEHATGIHYQSSPLERPSNRSASNLHWWKRHEKDWKGHFQDCHFFKSLTRTTVSPIFSPIQRVVFAMWDPAVPGSQQLAWNKVSFLPAHNLVVDSKKILICRSFMSLILQVQYRPWQLIIESGVHVMTTAAPAQLEIGSICYDKKSVEFNSPLCGAKSNQRNQYSCISGSMLILETFFGIFQLGVNGNCRFFTVVSTLYGQIWQMFLQKRSEPGRIKNCSS